MAFVIDSTTHRKLSKPLDFGYDERPAGQRPTSIIIHSTNGNRGSTFAGEARFLVNRPDVSAHYLEGKAGQIAEVLPPEYRAWHAGKATADYTNTRSIGIECHHAIGDNWPTMQIAALTWLVQRLMAIHDIPRNRIATHRAVALPPGRKVDPSDWSDAVFDEWRDGLVPQGTATTMVVTLNGVRIRQGPGIAFPIIGQLNASEIIAVDQIVEGEEVLGNRRWAHLADGRGYMTMSFLREVA